MPIRWSAAAPSGSRREAADAGVDGVICVDLPPEEDAELGPACAAQASTTHPPRHAHHRHGAPARRARWRGRVPLLRLGRRDHRQAAGRARLASKTRSRGSRPPPTCPSRWASACARRSRPRRSPKSPTAWWSAPRWSRSVGEHGNDARRKHLRQFRRKACATRSTMRGKAAA